MEQLDELDRQILAALVRNGRASWRLIADVVGQQERTVARRGNRLLDTGVVRINAFLNPTAVSGGAAIMLRVVSPPDQVRNTSRWLALQPEVSWVSALAGSNECVAEMFIPPEELGAFLYKRMAGATDADSFTSSPNFDYFRTPAGWKPDLLSQEQYRALHAGEDAGKAGVLASEHRHALDQDNQDIAAVLRGNGRATVEEVASSVQLSKATVRRRIESMIAGGALFIRAVLDPAALGLPLEAFLTISCERSRRAEAGRQLAGLPVTRWAASGETHLLAQIAVASLAELSRSIDVVHSLPGVTDVQTSLMAEIFKRSTVVYRDGAPDWDATPQENDAV